MHDFANDFDDCVEIHYTTTLSVLDCVQLSDAMCQSCHCSSIYEQQSIMTECSNLSVVCVFLQKTCLKRRRRKLQKQRRVKVCLLNVFTNCSSFHGLFKLVTLFQLECYSVERIHAPRPLIWQNCKLLNRRQVKHTHCRGVSFGPYLTVDLAIIMP